MRTYLLLLLSALVASIPAWGQTPSSPRPAQSSAASRGAASEVDPPPSLAVPTLTQTDPSLSQADPALAQARALLDQGKAADADRATRDYLQAHPDSADAHFLRGYILFRQVQTHAATNDNIPLATYQEPDAASPDGSFQQSAVKASLAEFTEGAKYRTPSAFDLKIVSLDYVLLGDYADADKWLTRSLQWNPKDSEGWYWLGRTKYNENRFEEAVSAFSEHLKLEPKSVRGEDNLGLSYQGLGKTDAAIAAYQTAIAWQSESAVKNPGPYLDLGILLLEQNRPQEAVSYLTQAVAIAPKESKHHEELGQAYSRLEEWQKAQQELETAVSLAPQNSRLHYLLGRVYRKEGFLDKANDEFHRSESLKSAENPQPSQRPN